MTYRSRTLACPVCPALLRAEGSAGGELDVCPDCGGVFIEWFDGEPSRVSRGLNPPPGPITLPQGGTGDCPACRIPLTISCYPEPDGADVLRCGQCASTFVPRASLSVLSALEPEQDPASDETGALAAVVQALRRAFGWDAS